MQAIIWIGICIHFLGSFHKCDADVFNNKYNTYLHETADFTEQQQQQQHVNGKCYAQLNPALATTESAHTCILKCMIAITHSRYTHTHSHVQYILHSHWYVSVYCTIQFFLGLPCVHFCLFHFRRNKTYLCMNVYFFFFYPFHRCIFRVCAVRIQQTTPYIFISEVHILYILSAELCALVL